VRHKVMQLAAEVETWPLVVPFRITGHTWEFVDVLVVTLTQDGCVGRGEAAGVYYKRDEPPAMRAAIQAQRTLIETGIDRSSLRSLFPPGGARNALDCALWDLEAKLSGRRAWQIAGLSPPRPLLTTFTCGADAPERMAAEVWLGVDANQAFSHDSLERLMPTLIDMQVALIEQPFPLSQDMLLDGFDSPIPIAADESAQSLRDLPSLIGRFQIVNIKLDKCGGLTEALDMARTAQALGFKAMVGNMLGTSLAMAPAFLVGQLCEVVDLDGPVFLKSDRAMTISYRDGAISCPETLWG
jgi:L-Ala-D/L-Glu epimerase